MNLYKSWKISEGSLDKNIHEYSTDVYTVNARLEELLQDTDLDTISFNVEDTFLLSATWTNQGGAKFMAIINCDEISDIAKEILNKY